MKERRPKPPEQSPAREKMRLPVVPVPNKTTWISDLLAAVPELKEFITPEGAVSPIGVTLQLADEDPSVGVLIVQSGHGRVGELPSMQSFRDDMGRLYTVAILKGIGYVNESDDGRVFADTPATAWRTPRDPRVKGYAHLAGLDLDARMAMELATYKGANGTIFRGSQTVVITQLSKMYKRVAKSDRVALQFIDQFPRSATPPVRSQDKDDVVLPENFTAGVDLRVVGVSDRCSDLAENDWEPTPRERIQVAQDFLSEDLESSILRTDTREYLRVVAQRLGESLGVAHVHGTVLLGVNPANVSLAGEPVDYDSAQEDESSVVLDWALEGQEEAATPRFSEILCKGIVRDVADVEEYKAGSAWGAVPTLFQLAADMREFGMDTIPNEKILDAFRKGYYKAFREVPPEVQEVVDRALCALMEN